MTLAGFLTVALLTLLGAISPGPAVLMSARTGLTEGMRTGFFLATGIGVGAMVWATAAMFGLNLLFQTAPIVLSALKLCGGVYLLYVAYGVWTGANDPITDSGDVAPRSATSAFLRGVVTQLINPKPVVVMSAIFLGTIPPATPYWVYLAILTVIFVNETVWNTLVARVFSHPHSRGIYLGLKPLIDRCFGGILAALGLKIAAT